MTHYIQHILSLLHDEEGELIITKGQVTVLNTADYCKHKYTTIGVADNNDETVIYDQINNKHSIFINLEEITKTTVTIDDDSEYAIEIELIEKGLPVWIRFISYSGGSGTGSEL